VYLVVIPDIHKVDHLLWNTRRIILSVFILHWNLELRWCVDCTQWKQQGCF